MHYIIIHRLLGGYIDFFVLGWDIFILQLYKKYQNYEFFLYSIIVYIIDYNL